MSGLRTSTHTEAEKKRRRKKKVSWVFATDYANDLHFISPPGIRVRANVKHEFKERLRFMVDKAFLFQRHHQRRPRNMYKILDCSHDIPR